MTWIATIATVGISAVGARNARRAGREEAAGADAAVAEQGRQFDTIRDDAAPGRGLYGSAINTLNRLHGYATPASGGYFSAAQYLAQNPDIAADEWASKNALQHWEQFGQHEGRQSPIVGGTPAREAGAPDMSGFLQSPDYQFRRDEGMRGIENSFAARGGAASGNALRALTEYNSNLASGEFGDYYNRLLAQAGLGQTANNTSAQAGMQTGANVGNALMTAGNARASGIVGSSNALTGGLSRAYDMWNYGRGGGNGGGGNWGWNTPPPLHTPPWNPDPDAWRWG